MSLPTIPIIEGIGSAREQGRQQGEGARQQILDAIAHYREILPLVIELTWEEGLRGIAEGSGVPFEEIWILNCYEGLTESRRQLWGCTSIAVRDDQTADGHVLLAHNEDSHSADRSNVYLVRSEPDDGLPFLGITYGPLLANVGLNGAGIGVAINSVYPTDGGGGVPRILYSRAMLNARTTGEAIRACVPKLREWRDGDAHLVEITDYH
jgi:hypothetical protein